MHHTKKDKGFTLIEALLIILILSVVGLGGWYVYNENQKTKPTPENTSASKNSTQQTNAENAYKIPELGIQFTLPIELKDLKHEYDSEYKTVAFYMPDLDKLADNCEDKGPMVINTWSKIDGQFDEDEAIGMGLIKQFDSYHIAATGGPSGRMCSDDKVIDLRVKYAKDLDEASLTVEEIE